MQPDFELWLEFELWVTDSPQSIPFDPESESFNAEVTLSTGEKYALNVWTFQFLEAARRECEKTGEYLGGRYLPAPDLFISRLDRLHIEEAIADMLAHDGGRLDEQWRVLDDD